MVHQENRHMEDAIHNRIVILEDLLKKVVDVHLSTETRVKRLDEKFGQMEVFASGMTHFLNRMEALQSAQVPVAVSTNDEIKQELAVMRREVLESLQSARESAVAIPGSDAVKLRLEVSDLRRDMAQLQEVISTLPERLSIQSAPASEPVTPLVEKLELLNQVPELFSKVENQQSTILQVLEARIDPRLMIYLKPLIEMLEEEGRQAEQMKNSALQQLNELMSGKRTGTDREISGMLTHVGDEIRKCQEAFERTQQALQIVVTPFQNVGRLFRNNLEIIVQAHDLMAQLHDDLPRFVTEMQSMVLEKGSVSEQ